VGKNGSESILKFPEIMEYGLLSAWFTKVLSIRYSKNTASPKMLRVSRTAPVRKEGVIQFISILSINSTWSFSAGWPGQVVNLDIKTVGQGISSAHRHVFYLDSIFGWDFTSID
jgi:hypothetical protein